MLCNYAVGTPSTWIQTMISAYKMQTITYTLSLDLKMGLQNYCIQFVVCLGRCSAFGGVPRAPPIKTHPSPYQPSLILLMGAPAEGWMQVSPARPPSQITPSVRACAHTTPQHPRATRSPGSPAGPHANSVQAHARHRDRPGTPQRPQSGAAHADNLWTRESHPNMQNIYVYL